MVPVTVREFVWNRVRARRWLSESALHCLLARPSILDDFKIRCRELPFGIGSDA